MTSQLIRLSLSNCPSSPVRAKVSIASRMTSLAARSWTAQPPGSRPQALQVAIHSQRVAGWGFTPLQRRSQHILQPQPTGQLIVWINSYKSQELEITNTTLLHIVEREQALFFLNLLTTKLQSDGIALINLLIWNQKCTTWQIKSQIKGCDLNQEPRQSTTEEFSINPAFNYLDYSEDT